MKNIKLSDMEPVPVPKNVIDAEFKLFGSFTVSQFLKILAGGLISLVIFFVEINILIKAPIMLLSIGVGFLMAWVPRFSFLFWGFVKAIFISPRYVWTREGYVPEILMEPQKTKKYEDLKVSVSKSTKKVDINSLPLAEILSQGSKVKTSAKDPSTDLLSNDPLEISYLSPGSSEIINKYFEQYQKNEEAKESLNNKNLNTNTQSLSDRTSGEASLIKKRKLPTNAKELAAEIKRLKFELFKLKKDANYTANEKKIIDQINELYREIKLLISKQDTNNLPNTSIQNQTKTNNTEGKEVFGIVVNKTNIPVGESKVIFISQNGEKIETITGTDGKFSTHKKLPFGEYSVSIEKPGMKFHSYKITIGTEVLPAFKFRER
ncbi:hypothetical protein D6810_01685 [Candidatus Dojkabacteria bacterium]|uniref:Uncharacterized protein n=1 Tax=Candidatus Dojkabacteria bacterium TaxID=2099670 RepID=A0A3M0Z149_9BACT|nr:MAG: hypothetical protein D6810_01685 [Candidatus Dojkabacteria bacterium]